MTNERFNKFIAALRSGNYNQLRGSLRVNDHFCAIGVLIDIIDPTTWRPRKGVSSSFLYPEFYDNQNLTQYTDTSAYGLSLLATWNDNYEYSFDQIADLLEEKKAEFINDNG